MSPHEETGATPLDATPFEAPAATATAARSPAKRVRWPFLIAVVLVAAGIGGGVCLTIYRTEAGRLLTLHGKALPPGGTATAKAPEKPRERTVSKAADPAECHTPIRIIRAGKDSGATIALGRPVGPTSLQAIEMTTQSILNRELVRQALLIAARDELGLATRDELMDDMTPAPGEAPPLELATLLRMKECHALIRRGTGDSAEVLQTHDLGTNPDSSKFNFDLTVKAEELSRKEFVAFLKQQGLEGRPNAIRDDAPVPADVEARLEQLSFADHVAALRSLHAAIRADGESPARLAALARAYAQLGVLAQYQWHPAHKIFKARAILYAERLCARRPDEAVGLRARAFVRALVGNHQSALFGLEQARSSEQKAGAGQAPAPPSWVPVIEAYLKGDRGRLTAKGGPHPRLALLLNMLNLEFPHHTRILVESARNVVSVDADCCHAYDTICENGQLGDLHVATVLGPDAFTKLFPVKLRSLKDLPDSVRQPLEKQGDEIWLVNALDKAGRPGADAGEPSWGTLAHLAREARFMHAYRRLAFMTGPWSVPAGEYFDDIQPFVARHRFFPYLQFLALAPQEGVPAPPGDGRSHRLRRDRPDRNGPDPGHPRHRPQVLRPRLEDGVHQRRYQLPRHGRRDPVRDEHEGPLRTDSPDDEPLFVLRDGHAGRERLGPG